MIVRQNSSVTSISSLFPSIFKWWKKLIKISLHHVDRRLAFIYPRHLPDWAGHSPFHLQYEARFGFTEWPTYITTPLHCTTVLPKDFVTMLRRALNTEPHSHFNLGPTPWPRGWDPCERALHDGVLMSYEFQRQLIRKSWSNMPLSHPPLSSSMIGTTTLHEQCGSEDPDRHSPTLLADDPCSFDSDWIPFRFAGLEP